MVLSLAESSSSTLPLTRLTSGDWVVKNAKVTDDELETLAGRSDLIIRAVDAPLSNISATVLQLFLRTHGSNLERFNLQNNKNIDSETFANLAQMMPQLKTLSFQYLHQVTDEDLLRVVESCKELEVLRISGNNQISKKAFHEILGLDRHFLELSLDLAGRSKSLQDVGHLEVKAQVEKLRLSGLSFVSSDMPHIPKIKELKNMELVLTSVDADAVASLSGGQFAITVQEMSSKKLASFEDCFRNRDISFARDGKKITIYQEASGGS